jgi:hypothetical protein
VRGGRPGLLDYFDGHDPVKLDIAFDAIAGEG